jgi:single-strand DNA-binding protein
MAKLTVVGNVASNPDMTITPNGKAVTKFSLAEKVRLRGPDGQWRDGDPNWFNVVAWEDLAEHVAESIPKGARVIVVGTLKQRSWEAADGDKRTVWDLVAEDVAASVRFANVAIRKLVRGAQAAGDDPWAGTDTTEPEF